MPLYAQTLQKVSIESKQVFVGREKLSLCDERCGFLAALHAHGYTHSAKPYGHVNA